MTEVKPVAGAGCTLITGASGLIGNAFAQELSAKRPVICLSRKKSRGEDVTAIQGEFHSFEDLRQLDSFDISCVVHLAAVTGGCSEEEGLAVNVLGTRRLLRYALDRGCRKFVLASSIAAAGCLSDAFLPLQLPIPDEHPCLAYDAYGFSKAMMEELTRYFHRVVPDSDFINLRIGLVDSTDVPHLFAAGDPLGWPFVTKNSGRLIGYLCVAMLAGVGSISAPASSFSPNANTVLPSAHELDNWLNAPGVDATLFRVSSFPPTSGKLTAGACFGLP